MHFINLLIPVLMSTATVNTTAVENAKVKEVQQTRLREVINVHSAELWKIVDRGFSDAPVWSSAIDHSEALGSAQFEGATYNKRYCEVNSVGFDKIQEKLTLYNYEKMELAYI